MSKRYACIHIYIHAYIYTCIHAYIYKYIHTHMHAYSIKHLFLECTDVFTEFANLYEGFDIMRYTTDRIGSLLCYNRLESMKKTLVYALWMDCAFRVHSFIRENGMRANFRLRDYMMP